MKIKKGEHGIGIFKGYETFTDKVEDKDGKTKFKTATRPLGFARVFNEEQVQKYE